MAPPKITLFLDIVSPFAYQAFYVLQNSPVFKKCEITYIPIFLGGVMKSTGNTAPLFIKNKDTWIHNEMIRGAKRFDIPMDGKMPEGFPVNTVSVMRALCVLSQSHPDKLAESFAQLYHALWAEHKDAHKPDVYVPILAGIVGESEAKKVAEQATQPAAKQMLNKNTEHAIAEGAFGLPWFIATNSKGEVEKHWGFDHLGLVVEHLGLDVGTAKPFRSLL